MQSTLHFAPIKAVSFSLFIIFFFFLVSVIIADVYLCLVAHSFLCHKENLMDFSSLLFLKEMKAEKKKIAPKPLTYKEVPHVLSAFLFSSSSSSFSFPTVPNLSLFTLISATAAAKWKKKTRVKVKRLNNNLLILFFSQRSMNVLGRI